jgi:hypothetical protein
MNLLTPGKPPTSADHIKKAEENKKFGMGIAHDHPTPAGWALVALFYSALHFVEAYLNKRSIFPSNHNERKDQILTLPELNAIYSQYRFLSDFGFNARYRFNVYGKDQFREALPRLEQIERHIKTLLPPN